MRMADFIASGFVKKHILRKGNCDTNKGQVHELLIAPFAYNQHEKKYQEFQLKDTKARTCKSSILTFRPNNRSKKIGAFETEKKMT